MREGHSPVVKVEPYQLEWKRIDKLSWEDVPVSKKKRIAGNSIRVGWNYTFQKLGEVVYFAFTYPFSFEEFQAQLRGIDERAQSNEFRQAIFYEHTQLCRSLEGRPVDLLTVSSQPKIDGRKTKPLSQKPVIFLSARIHSGEVPGSHMMNGALDLLFSLDDPRAWILRELFVFKIVPMLNPDGVARGHYRLNSTGLNLNRFYEQPKSTEHEAVFHIKKLVTLTARTQRIAYYFDCHAHAQISGCHLIGNKLVGRAQVRNILFAKLFSLNSPSLCFRRCAFESAKKSKKDKDGLSRYTGSGRACVSQLTDCVNCYSLEANYNTCKPKNSMDSRWGDTIPKFTVEMYQDVGRSLLVTVLDIEGKNPESLIPKTEFKALENVEKWVENYIKHKRKTRL